MEAKLAWQLDDANDPATPQSPRCSDVSERRQENPRECNRRVVPLTCTSCCSRRRRRQDDNASVPAASDPLEKIGVEQVLWTADGSFVHDQMRTAATTAAGAPKRASAFAAFEICLATLENQVDVLRRSWATMKGHRVSADEDDLNPVAGELHQ